MTQTPSLTYRLTRGDLAVIFYLSLVRMIFHLIVNFSGGYGLFRDELYYVACTDHLAMGYVDQPPLSVFLLKGIISIFGDSLFAIRLIPAIVSACTAFVTGLMVIRLGGKLWAQIIACVASASLISLAMHSFYSMNCIDFLVWALVAYLVLLIIDEQNKKYWIVLGFVLGFGLMNKIGVLFLGVGLFMGILFTPQRKWFTTPWPYVCGAIAFVFFVPYIIWNLQHDLAHLEFIKNASGQKYAALTVIDFLMGQFLMNNPIAIIIWLTGLMSLLFVKAFKPYRALAFLYLGPLLIFLVNGTSKSEYLAPGYAVLWAAGAVMIENFGLRFKKPALIPATILALVLISQIALLPLVVPILPVERYIKYAEALGEKPSSSENKALAELPQFYADMFGWDTKARDVAKAFATLTKEEQQKCAIVASNYGRCGAIDYYGTQYNLPKAIGTHNNYWIWGPRDYTGELVLILGGTYDDHVNDFQEVKLVGVSDCQYCMPYEDNLNIFICRGLKVPLAEAWPLEKHYD